MPVTVKDVNMELLKEIVVSGRKLNKNVQLRQIPDYKCYKFFLGLGCCQSQKTVSLNLHRIQALPLTTIAVQKA